MSAIRRPEKLSPWLFPWRISAERQYIDFINVPRNLFETCTFHDRAHLEGRVLDGRRMSFAEVLAYSSKDFDGLSPPHYIFHHAFNCSTLLARHLACAGETFVYREPAALTELALIDIRDSAFLRAESGSLLLGAIASVATRTRAGPAVV